MANMDWASTNSLILPIFAPHIHVPCVGRNCHRNGHHATVQAGDISNITLRNITVNNAKKNPGVLFGNSSTPMENLVFENVVFNNPAKGKEQYFKCAGVGNAVATGNTNPVPSCFKDLTQG